MSEVCWRCISDPHLRRIIWKSGTAGECDLCHNQRKRVFTAVALAKVVAPIIQEHFAIGEDERVFGEDDKDDHWEQKGDPLSHHLQEVIGTYLGFEDEVVEELSNQEDVDWHDGGSAFFDTSQNYVEKGVSTHRWREQWERVATALRHEHRFFNDEATAFFKELFGGLEELRYWGSGEQKQGVVIDVSVGTEIFRARVCDSSSLLKDAFAQPEKTVGPPPPGLARAGRMNVDGVSVLYGGMDLETCVAELRPAIGSLVAVIKFQTTKELRLLDFTRLDRCSSALSYFQPDFQTEASRLKFLRGLGVRISRPVVPGREADYIITQCLAEYLSHVHDKPFSGIFYSSAQHAGGMKCNPLWRPV